MSLACPRLWAGQARVSPAAEACNERPLQLKPRLDLPAFWPSRRNMKCWKKKPSGIEFAKHFRFHLIPVEGLAVSNDDTQFAVTSPDCRIRVFWFKTGKLRRVYDESLEVAQDLQKSDVPWYHLDAIDFGRRVAVEKEKKNIENVPQPNAIFDESINFLIYSTLLGIKVEMLKGGNNAERWKTRQHAEKWK